MSTNSFLFIVDFLIPVILLTLIIQRIMKEIDRDKEIMDIIEEAIFDTSNFDLHGGSIEHRHIIRRAIANDIFYNDFFDTPAKWIKKRPPEEIKKIVDHLEKWLVYQYKFREVQFPTKEEFLENGLVDYVSL